MCAAALPHSTRVMAYLHMIKFEYPAAART